MLMIRLQRAGKKSQHRFRLVVSDKKKDLFGPQLEILGHYDPVSIPKTISLKAERIKHWLGVGAKPSATVHNLLVREQVIQAEKVTAWKPRKKAKPEESADRAKPETEEQKQA